MADNRREFLRYRPAAAYYRMAIRKAKSPDELVRIGMALCQEVELLKAQIREKGDIPRRIYNPRDVLAQTLRNERDYESCDKT